MEISELLEIDKIMKILSFIFVGLLIWGIYRNKAIRARINLLKAKREIKKELSSAEIELSRTLERLTYLEEQLEEVFFRAFGNYHSEKEEIFTKFSNINLDADIAEIQDKFLDEICRLLISRYSQSVYIRYLSTTEYFECMDSFSENLKNSLVKAYDESKSDDIFQRIVTAAGSANSPDAIPWAALATFASGHAAEIGGVAFLLDRSRVLLQEMINIGAEEDLAEAKKDYQSIAVAIERKRFQMELTKAQIYLIQDNIKFIYLVYRLLNPRNIQIQEFDEQQIDDNGKVDFTKLKEEEKQYLFGKFLIQRILTLIRVLNLKTEEIEDGAKEEGVSASVIAVGMYHALKDFCAHYWDLRTEYVTLTEVSSFSWDISSKDIEKFKEEFEDDLEFVKEIVPGFKDRCLEGWKKYMANNQAEPGGETEENPEGNTDEISEQISEMLGDAISEVYRRHDEIKH